MDHSVTFARHFAHLVWLLVHEPSNVPSQKTALRSLVGLSREATIALLLHDGQLFANGALVPSPLPGVAELAERMGACQLASVELDVAAGAADLLAAARTLAAGGLVPLHAGEPVRFVVAEPPPAQPIDTYALPDVDLGALEAPPAPRPAPPPRPVAPRSLALDTSSHSMFDHFAAKRAPVGARDALLAQLETATKPDLLIRVLDDLARTAEQAARDGHMADASEIFHRIVRRERENQDFEAKRAFVLTIRRLSSGPLLRAVAEELVRDPDRREEHMAVLTRAGEDGADALIDQLISATGRSDRRIYFDALIELQAGVPTLLHMLGDPRWFVARNAAALLGEIQAREAEGPLADLLHHDDERVRHAATIALMRLGSPRSLPAIEQALHDSAPQIRIQAAVALVEHRGGGTAGPLLRALDAERDDEVKTAFLLALGRLATPDAVERLILAAQPERGLFRKRVAGLRVAAVQALAAARTSEALRALHALMDDREPEVREAAGIALLEGRVGQGGAGPRASDRP
jgi:HEAT repeat protein